MDDLIINKEEAERFLTLIDEEAEQFTFQVIKDYDKAAGHAEIMHGTLDDLFPKLSEANYKGLGVFVCVNETNGQGRKAEDVTRVRALYQDDDQGDAQALPLEPHLVVETSPNKYHRYMLVKNAPIEEFSGVQRSMVKKFGGDPAVVDISRVMRVPGFLHQKGVPFVSRIIHESGMLEYDWKKVVTVFGRAKFESEVFDVEEHLGFDPLEAIKSILESDSYHDSITRLAARYVAKGIPQSEIVSMIQGWMGASSDRSERWLSRFREIDRAVESASQKFSNQLPKELEHEDDECSLDALMSYEFPPMRWAIEDILPAGTTLLFGKPKKGKSFLSHCIALAVASGQDVFGCTSVPMPVKFMGLEDNLRRLQVRTRAIIDHFGMDASTMDVTFSTVEPRIDNGLIPKLDQWVKEHGGRGLIVVDMLKKIQGQKRGGDVYTEQAFEGDSLTQWAKAYPELAVIVIHHARKADTDDPFDGLSGTTGMSGSYDNLFAVAGDDEQVLHTTGRDIEPSEFKLMKQDGIFTLENANYDEEAKVEGNYAVVMRQIYDGVESMREIEAKTGLTYDTVNNAVRKLVKIGKVEKNGRGKYKARSSTFFPI